MTRRPTPGCAAKNQKLNVAAGVPRQQRGVVLLIALIMLVAMTVVGPVSYTHLDVYKIQGSH